MIGGIATVLLVTLAAVGRVAGVPACGLVSTIAWNPTCVPPMTAACFTPARLPLPTDVLSVPAGTNAVLSKQIWKLTGVVVEAGAALELSDTAELAVTDCIQVQLGAVLTLDSRGVNASAGPGDAFFPPDPSVANVDCAMMPGGWSPRLCGPGRLVVHGTVNIKSFYAGLFTNTHVAASGAVQLLGAGTFLGMLENHGSLALPGYVFGSILNYGTLSLTSAQFALPQNQNQTGPRQQINLTNYGTLTVDGFTGVGTNADCQVFNYGNMTVSYPQILYFSVIVNHGTLTFQNASNATQVAQVIVNMGLLVADDTILYIGRYVSDGGTTQSQNDGIIHFGNGAGPAVPDGLMDPLACSAADWQAAVDRNEHAASALAQWHATRNGSTRNAATATCTNNADCGPGGCCLDSKECVDVCGGECCDDCNEYGVYDPCNNPYFLHAGQQLTKGGSSRLPPASTTDELCLRLPAAADGVLPRIAAGAMHRKHRRGQAGPPPSRFRYSFRGNSVVEATIVSTDPVEIAGVVVARGAGLRWFGMTEFQLPVFVGGGTLRVADGYELVLGLDSSLSVDGAIHLDAQSTLRIPQHGALHVGNHSLVLPPGAQLLVDGTFVVGKGARLDVCGTVRTQMGPAAMGPGPGRLLATDDSSIEALCQKK